MAITYETRKGLSGDILVKIDENGTESFVPMDESNSDYQTYLRWVENPNAPEFQTPWVEPQLTK